jgi:hypothetical protein
MEQNSGCRNDARLVSRNENSHRFRVFQRKREEHGESTAAASNSSQIHYQAILRPNL